MVEIARACSYLTVTHQKRLQFQGQGQGQSRTINTGRKQMAVTGLPLNLVDHFGIQSQTNSTVILKILKTRKISIRVVDLGCTLTTLHLVRGIAPTP